MKHLLFCCVAVGIAAANVAQAHADEPLTFEQHVRPILKAYCLDCHGAGDNVRGGLDLRLKRFLEKGGKTGPAIVVGEAAKSPLVQRMKSGEMPTTEKKVPAEMIAVVEKWIAGGAVAKRAEPVSLPPGIDITPEERAYWFYQPIRRVNPPHPQPLSPGARGDLDRVRTPIDAFVLTKLREKKLSFQPDADRLTLIRRATLDLLGLPPTQKEIDAFLADTSSDAYEKLLDRLLASPHYGERWARHWLDVVGYADSAGDGVNDTVRPYAWKYRDYVIRALNADKPLDQFIAEQLAGDELLPLPWNNLKAPDIDLLAATGFLRTAPDPTASRTGQAEAEQVVTDTLKIVGSALLGLTVGCAQCHDHRYDPIPQADYYRLRAIFEPALNPAQWRGLGQRRVSLYTDADRARSAAIDAEAGKMQAALNQKQLDYVETAFQKEILKFPAEQRDALRVAFRTPAAKATEEQKRLVAANPKLNIGPGVLYQYNQAAADEIKKQQGVIDAKRAQKPVEDFVDVLNEAGAVPVTHIFHRGDYRQPKTPVQPGDLTIAAPDGKRCEISGKDAKSKSSGRRLAYARHLTSSDHPLLSRVLVNRIWLHHFGRGIVDTPGDFGILGQRPSHPELLDWLATELMQPDKGAKWGMKRMHKLIMLSTVYRQSSRRSKEQDAVDGSNALLGRYPLRRLDAEALRDRILVTTGRLDRAAFGPPIGVVEDTVGQGNAPDDKPRRSIYLQVRRTKPVAFLAAFDAPTAELNCERRLATTSAPQALMLMNSDFILQQAGYLAKRIRKETPIPLEGHPSPPGRGVGGEGDALRALATKYPRAADAWQYGYGTYDPETKRTARFEKLSHWTGSAWQGGPVLPDPKVGWAILHAAGGHAGNDQQHASVRRWIAPRDGNLAIAGQFGHPSPNGDGVRGRIVSSRHGLLGEWSIKTKGVATDIKAVAVKAGDSIDFAVDCLENPNSDSYGWTLDLSLQDVNGQKAAWKSSMEFRGPGGAAPPLAHYAAFAWRETYQRSATFDELDAACRFLIRQSDHLRSSGNADPELAALTNLCQQLLSSNEFLYVD